MRQSVMRKSCGLQARWRLAMLAVGFAVLAGDLEAQEILGGRWEQSFRWDHSVIFNYQDGGDVAYVDDLDQDGWMDMVFGEDYSGHGSVMAISGRTGAILWYRMAPDLGANGYLRHFGDWIDPTIDLFGGGVRDIILSGLDDYFGKGYVLFVFSTDLFQPWLMLEDPGNASGMGLPPWTNFGTGFQSSNVVGLPDTDGDGYPDILVGAIGASQVANERSRGAVFAFSLRDGFPQIWRLDGSQEFGYFGATLAPVGDFTGDGKTEVAIGEPGDNTAAQAGGAIHIYDPYGRVIVASFYGAQPGWGYGRLLEPLGDVNGDRVPDILTGFEFATTGYPNGYVRALSGADGSEVWTAAGLLPDQQFGHSADCSSDLDGDGIQDAVVASLWPVPGGRSRVDIFSGATGQRLWTFEPADKRTELAWHLAVWADLARGREPRLLLHSHTDYGQPYKDWNEELVFDPFLWPSRRTVSAAAGGQVQYALDFPDTAAGTAYQLLASGSGRGPTTLGGLEIPLTADALFQRSLQGLLPWTSGASGALDAFGDATATFTPPAGALSSWVGRTLWTAAVSYRAWGSGLSSVAVPLQVRP